MRERGRPRKTQFQPHLPPPRPPGSGEGEPGPRGVWWTGGGPGQSRAADRKAERTARRAEGLLLGPWPGLGVGPPLALPAWAPHLPRNLPYLPRNRRPRPARERRHLPAPLRTCGRAPHACPRSGRSAAWRSRKEHPHSLSPRVCRAGQCTVSQSRCLAPTCHQARGGGLRKLSSLAPGSLLGVGNKAANAMCPLSQELPCDSQRQASFFGVFPALNIFHVYRVGARWPGQEDEQELLSDLKERTVE